MLSPSKTSSLFDLAVVGAGPAAHAVAAAAAERGLVVCLVAPKPEGRWQPRYGMWSSELPERYQTAVAQRWAETRVVVDEEGQDERILPHGYLALDTQGLQSLMQARSEAAGVRTRRGHVVALEHNATGSELVRAERPALQARVVVDASGAGSQLVKRGDRRQPAFQTAYGQLVRVTSHSLSEKQMTLMDFAGVRAQEAATFLYAQPLDAQHIFVEETSLVARPGAPLSLLKERLRQRLGRMNIRVQEVLDEEYCAIPMGISLPQRRQRAIAYGAAGSFVHPATGYQLARALFEAEGVADAIVLGLSGEGPADAARRAYRYIWPNARLRSWELYTFGMNVLCKFNAEQTRQFLRTFFSLSPEHWLGFLQATLSPQGVAQAMLGLFGEAPSDLRSRLFRFGAGPGLPTLLRAVTPRMSL